MDNFFSAKDLELLNEELEVDAAARRYEEIIKKHKGDR